MRVWLLLFRFVSALISFWCLIALSRTSRTKLNRYGESGQPCLFPDFSEITLGFSFLVWCWLLYIAFIMFGFVPCIPALSMTFIMEGCWILLKDFSAFNEMIMHFSPSLFIWWITLTDFVYWTIPSSLGWNQLDHGGWWFCCVLGLDLPVFYLVFLHRCSWVRLVCNSLS